ncbi:MAG: type I-C CRISPR-associated protein Cas8c/Csd1 [Actinomycetota bacterium]
MLLQRLVEYSERLELPPPLYAKTPVRYLIELDGGGRLVNRSPVDRAESASGRGSRGGVLTVPQIVRSSGVQPLLLADNAEYTLGLGRETSKPERVAACHAAYRDLVRACAAASGEPAIQAVQSFLDSGGASELDLPADFDRGATVTFRVDGTFPVDLPAVQRYWADLHSPEADGAPVMECVVCGRRRPVLERLQAKLKGVPGGQTSGTALISANAEAFESYGLQASLVAPTCAECGERFTKAANDLLSSLTNRVVLGGAAFIFWTRDPAVEVPLRALLTEPQQEQVRELLASVRTGRRVPLDETAFYGTVLSGSGGRAVVRDWIDTTVGSVKANVASWFERQRIVDASGAVLPPLGLFALARATVREPRDLAPTTPRALVRCAVQGTPLPWDLLYQAVRRNRAEQKVTSWRAALIKLVLSTNGCLGKGEGMIQLNEDSVEPAYRCGRLLAVLEEVQRAAIPGAKATIVDRFFGTASSAPASVFGRLLRGAQPHLAKLERDRRGAYVALQRRLENVQAGLSGFPRTLTLEQQGLFALGYYHQRAADRAQAKEAGERRKAGLPAAGEDLGADAGLLAFDPTDNEGEG